MTKKTSISLDEIKIVGIGSRTSNKAEIEGDTSKILLYSQRFTKENIENKVANKIKNGLQYLVYSNYSQKPFNMYSYMCAEYDFIIGMEVSSFENVDNQLQTFIIPAQKYIKFIGSYLPNDYESLATTVGSIWDEIWKAEESELGGKRNYLADFEVYSKSDSSVEIFVGIED